MNILAGGSKTAMRLDTDKMVARTDGKIGWMIFNNPARRNAVSLEMWQAVGTILEAFQLDDEIRVVILTGAGRAFSAGFDIGGPGDVGGEIYDLQPDEWRRRLKENIDTFMMIWHLSKPVIAAINGFAMGGGFQLVERTDLRVAVRGAIFEISEAKRWLLGGYNHGFLAGLPHPIATEMALGFRFTAERLYEVGFLNRLVEPDELLSTAFDMAAHILTLPPASRVNTVYMMHQMLPRVAPNLQQLATELHEHGAKDDLMESRRAFAEKRKPDFRGR